MGNVSLCSMPITTSASSAVESGGNHTAKPSVEKYAESKRGREKRLLAERELLDQKRRDEQAAREAEREAERTRAREQLEREQQKLADEQASQQKRQQHAEKQLFEFLDSLQSEAAFYEKTGLPEMSGQQKKVVEAPGPVFVQGRSGTGKTTVLERRALAHDLAFARRKSAWLRRKEERETARAEIARAERERLVQACEKARLKREGGLPPPLGGGGVNKQLSLLDVRTGAGFSSAVYPTEERVSLLDARAAGAVLHSSRGSATVRDHDLPPADPLALFVTASPHLADAIQQHYARIWECVYPQDTALRGNHPGGPPGAGGDPTNKSPSCKSPVCKSPSSKKNKRSISPEAEADSHDSRRRPRNFSDLGEGPQTLVLTFSQYLQTLDASIADNCPFFADDSTKSQEVTPSRFFTELWPKLKVRSYFNPNSSRTPGETVWPRRRCLGGRDKWGAKELPQLYNLLLPKNYGAV